LGLGLSAGAQQYGYKETDNITYTSVGGVVRQLDLFQPTLATSKMGPVSYVHQILSQLKNNNTYPGIIFVHGGGWTAGEKEDFQAWGQYYAEQGYVCTSINYRMTPQYVWPAEIDDTQAAVRWMRKNAQSIGLVPSQIGAVGASAGGHLVLFLGETDTLNDIDPALSGYSSKVQAVGDYYGPTDFSNFHEWDPGIWSLVQSLLNYSTARSDYYWASPINWVSNAEAPMMVFQGDADPTVPVTQARRIVAKMQSIGAPVTYYEFPGQGHGFDGPTTWQSILYLNDFFAATL
jgi:acetyl esterase/lipase